MLPQEMTVIEISQPGGPEVLKPAKRPLPQPGAGAVLIKDAACAVLGAVGASGGTGDEDEEICIAGVTETGLQAG